MLKGIDISGWQAGILPGRLPINFAIVKATEGTGYVSNNFRKQADSTLAGNKLLGLYHFARNGNAISEADYFINAVKSYLKKAILVLDWEAGNLDNIAWVKAWCDRVTARTGIKPIVYSSASVFRSYNWSPIAKDYGVWVAGYPSAQPETLRFPSIPAAYQPGSGLNIVMWQYSSNGRVPGYSGPLDLDVWYGDKTTWHKYANPNGVKTALRKTTATVKQAVTTARRTTHGKTVDQLADEVIRGIWGNDPQRSRALGYLAEPVQAVVNRRFGARVDLTNLARRTRRGDFGNNPIRARLLGSLYAEIQTLVNRMY